jgi:hypothetical protein
MSPQTWKSASVEMLVELSPFDRRAVRFDDPVNIIRLTEKLARYMDC